jgi:glyoxylase-like metal-dependent hydrolase (beta-lactamase superfamily II)
MTAPLPEYAIHAIRYAERSATRRDHFLGGDPHEGPMPMDYFVWTIQGEGMQIAVDCGFTAEVAAQRRRQHLRCPVDALELVGMNAAAVQHVIVTHLHYDHVGNLKRFPNARFHLQESEMHHACGRHMGDPFNSHAYECEDVVDMVRLNFAGRVEFYASPAELAPGIQLIPTGGHTPGMQFVRVHTRRGWVVLASDTSHFYENIESGRPFPGLYCVPDVIAGFRAVRAAADSPAHIVPGHDPMVMKRYPAPSKELEGIVARLDVPPMN